jgi:hypothetical protein
MRHEGKVKRRIPEAAASCIADCLPSVGSAKEVGFPPSLKLRRTGRIADRGLSDPSYSSDPSNPTYLRNWKSQLRIAEIIQKLKIEIGKAEMDRIWRRSQTA